MFRNEGAKAFYKGITPRVLRVAPGQAIVFTVSPDQEAYADNQVYERMKRLIDKAKTSFDDEEYNE
jgi:solute carrier family 25 citrate transporter 1